MTRIEKAVKIVSDLYDFYRRIPNVLLPNPTGDGQNGRKVPLIKSERHLVDRS